MAIGVAAIVFAGFARTYFLRPLFFRAPLPLLLHVHGAVITSWILLFFTQTCLIAAHRVDWHRRLGIVGAALAVVLVGVVTSVIVVGQRRDFELGHPHLPGMAFQLSIVLVFAVLVATAILQRRRSDIHKRSMLLACLSILTPGIVRIPLHFIHNGGLFSLFGVLDLGILICVCVDAALHRRIHPAFVWGGMLIVVFQPLCLLLGAISVWLRFATWLVS